MSYLDLCFCERVNDGTHCYGIAPKWSMKAGDVAIIEPNNLVYIRRVITVEEEGDVLEFIKYSALYHFYKVLARLDSYEFTQEGEENGRVDTDTE